LEKVHRHPPQKAKEMAEEILERFKSLSKGDLVILVQSTSFRLDQFRIRIVLFNLGLKVMEHPHLARIPEAEYETYLDSLAYDSSYFRRVGAGLKERIEKSGRTVLFAGQDELVFDSPLEPPRLNIGDYSLLKNTGGQFPIGEVFTEACDLRKVHGRTMIFAFGDREFMARPADPPITAVIEAGLIIRVENAPEAFLEVLEDIRKEEGDVWVRELGFGLNRAMTRERRVMDIGTYERMCGIHLSLGGKHAIYRKPGFSRKHRFHVDVFAVTDRVEIDGEIIYQNGSYLL